MPAQKVGTGFWWYGNLLTSFAEVSHDNTNPIMAAFTGGRFTSTSSYSGKLTSVYTASPINNESNGETNYKINNGSYYTSAFLFGVNTGFTASALCLSEIQDGFEIHANGLVANSFTENLGFMFTFAGVTYACNWTRDTGIEFRYSTDAYASNLLTQVSSGNATNRTWKEHKLRVTVTGSNPNKVLSVKYSASAGGNAYLGYYQSGATLNGTITYLRTLASVNAGYEAIDNLSLYVFSAGESSTIATNWGTQKAINDMLVFQRYLPLIDKAGVGGTSWTGSNTTALEDIADGNVSTYATTKSSNPIGFNSNGLTISQIAARTYTWTSGSLSVLAGLGIIKTLIQSAFSVANTTPETNYMKFSDGTETVTKNVSLTGNPSGENVVGIIHSSNGTFTADSGTLTITTADTIESTLQRA